MKIIAKTNNYKLYSNFGKTVNEGSLEGKSEGSGKVLTFSVEQVNPVYKTGYITITPNNGVYGDSGIASGQTGSVARLPMILPSVPL